jgi:hypothetical protein
LGVFDGSSEIALSTYSYFDQTLEKPGQWVCKLLQGGQPMFKTVRSLALLFAVSLTSASLAADADENVRCEDVASIGVATMTQDGVIRMRIRSLPPGPLRKACFNMSPATPSTRRSGSISGVSHPVSQNQFDHGAR